MSSAEEMDQIKAFFPTFISFTSYRRFAEERAQLVETVYQIRREDQTGEQQSGENYNVGYSSFFSQRNLANHPNFANLVAFIREKARNLAKFLRFDLENYELTMPSLPSCKITNPRPTTSLRCMVIPSRAIWLMCSIAL